jgi:hypothetical protein
LVNLRHCSQITNDVDRSRHASDRHFARVIDIVGSPLSIVPTQLLPNLPAEVALPVSGSSGQNNRGCMLALWLKCSQHFAFNWMRKRKRPDASPLG